MLDLKALESFVDAAETLNFSVTAARRHTVQSAISAQIKKLEETLEKTLFVRGRGMAMELTPEGRAFAVDARRIVNLSDEAVAKIRSTRSTGVIRLGTTATLAMSVLPQVLRAFARAHADVQIEVLCDRSSALLRRMDRGDIDVAFMMDQGERTDRVFVENMPLVWAAGAGFAAVPGGDVPLVFQTGGRDLRRYAFEALDRAGRTGYIAHLSDDPIGMRAFVIAGLALTVMPAVSVTAPLQVVGADSGLPALTSVALSFYRAVGGHANAASTLAEIVQRLVAQDRHAMSKGPAGMEGPDVA